MIPEYYTYEAGMHCPDHAYERFGDSLDDPETVDGEGNPIGAVFSWETSDDDYCEECVYELIAGRTER